MMTTETCLLSAKWLHAGSKKQKEVQTLSSEGGTKHCGHSIAGCLPEGPNILI